MKTAYRFAFVLIVTFLAAGCAVTEDNVDEVWGTTSEALTSAQTELATSAAINGAFSVGDDDVDAELTVTANCTDGGSMTLVGSYGISLSDSATAIGYDLAVAFEDCRHEETTINGNMDWVLSVATEEGAEVRFSWTGDLNYSGKYVGACEIDMFAEASVTGMTASLSYEGTVCGYDASAALSASADDASASLDM
jgi:hypothetical protein